MKQIVLAALFSGLTILTVQAQNSAPLEFKGKKASLTVNTYGSAIADFHFNNKPVNPLSWKLQPSDMPKAMQKGPVFQGHFLCVGRWGSPSEAEKLAGIPHNGEVNTETWKVVQPVTKVGNFVKAETKCTLPLERMEITRNIEMSDTGSFFVVREQIKNTNSLGRVYNYVQHATMGAPFLAKTSLIDCNAGLGFDQASEYNQLEKESFTWPNANLKTGGAANLRLTTDDRGYCTTHIFPDTVKLGWVTASSPESGVLIGYLFKTKEYPFINLWHYSKDGKPFAHGLEFGTTGLGQPYKLLTEKLVSFYGHPSFEYIEANETLEKSFVCFLAPIPSDFKGVEKVEVLNGVVSLEEMGGKRILKVGKVGKW